MSTVRDHVIRDKDGNVVQRSRNLAGIRRYVGGHTPPLIKVLAIDRIGVKNLEGKLMILFENGNSYETNFGDFGVLAGFVARWRNVYGAPLRVNGEDCGKVSYDNPKLLC
jgi:hypothetical protein